jgi:hypothetical protein
MDWQARYYPLDLFPGLSTKIGELITANQFKAVDLVREEIEAVAPTGLKIWPASSGIFLPLVPEIQAEGAAIEALYPDLADPKGIYQSADAYLIAHAKLESGIVLSQETSAHEKPNSKKKHFIPDVCRDLGVPCINLLGLMRREKWRF